MATEALKFAKFDHPKHGTYESPEHVLNDDRLSETEKQMILDEWRSSLKHILANEPDAPEVRSTHRSLDEAAERLAAGRI
ncbi:hypothetical protein [Jiella marina]|uniref:hypothetical protein n=1 Tax=Jiella sp. LLJ827 TaxID=2917712 RepID=UPI0021006A78|nr:hypothetical protein [Jiella sp. LLJ827]MCQ0990207.1 hypothetical protein [Jiella sp. LLJ827]